MAKEQAGVVKAPKPDALTRQRRSMREFAMAVMALDAGDGNAVGGDSGNGSRVVLGIEVATGRKFQGYSAKGGHYWVRIK